MRSRVAEQKVEMSIRVRRLAIAIFVLATVAFPAAAASTPAERTVVRIPVVEVTGLVDPIQADFLDHALTGAARQHDRWVVLRIDSGGAVISDARLNELARHIEHGGVPVAVWIGPGRHARASGGAARLVQAADKVGRVPGAAADTRRDVVAATLGDFIVQLDGVPTKVVRRAGRPPQRQLASTAQVAFAQPSLPAQLLHGVATPSVTFLLLVAGLLLLVFEFFTAGVGVAAGVGVLSLGLSAYGIGVLPTRWPALAAVAVGIFGYSIDVQAGAPRAWTVIGTFSLAAGSGLLFSGPAPSLIVIALVVAGVALFMVAGMPAMVRTRFATPTIGRESMIGEEGRATSDIDPEGVVNVREAPWRARTNRATPIRAGDAVRVAGIDGLLLEVEPLEGAARDAGH